MKVDNIAEIVKMAKEDSDYEHWLMLVAAESLRNRYGVYIWVAPIKYFSSNGKLEKEVFAWEAEFHDGSNKSCGYCGEKEFKTYHDAFKDAVSYCNQKLNSGE